MSNSKSKRLKRTAPKTIQLGKVLYRGAPPTFTTIQHPIPDTDPVLHREVVVQVTKGNPYIRITEKDGSPRDFSKKEA